MLKMQATEDHDDSEQTGMTLQDTLWIIEVLDHCLQATKLYSSHLQSQLGIKKKDSPVMNVQFNKPLPSLMAKGYDAFKFEQASLKAAKWHGNFFEDVVASSYHYRPPRAPSLPAALTRQNKSPEFVASGPSTSTFALYWKYFDSNGACVRTPSTQSEQGYPVPEP